MPTQTWKTQSNQDVGQSVESLLQKFGGNNEVLDQGGDSRRQTKHYLFGVVQKDRRMAVKKANEKNRNVCGDWKMAERTKAAVQLVSS